METNNKKSKTIIIILVLIIIALGGYVVYDTFMVKDKNADCIDNTKKVEKTSKTESTKFKDKNDILLKDKSKEIVYDLYNKKLNDSGYEYVHQLPVVNIKSEYANKINKDISALNEELKNSPEGYFYYYYVNDEILSLVIEEKTPSDYTEEHTYNLNIYTGEKIYNEDLLEIKNITKESVIEKLNNYSRNNKLINVRESSIYDTEKMNELFLGSSMYLGDNKELIITAHFQGEEGGLPPHNYIYNVDQNKEIVLKK